MEPLQIIKIGGNIIEDAVALNSFLKQFSSLPSRKILVHGGGKSATELAGKLGVPQTLVAGRRITDAETLKIITMVYGGWINKDIVARLQSFQCNAIGVSGADANLISAEKRNHPSIDYGFAGDLNANSIDTKIIQLFLENQLTPVFNAITHNGKGQLLNTNADTIAAALAIALSPFYKTSLVYCFEKKGVLSDLQDEDSCMATLNKSGFNELKNSGTIQKGMIPKLDNAFHALDSGVPFIRICSAENIFEPFTGTAII
jgi:acetylglutamate kinase